MLSSHSASILRRVEPRCVRHFRQDGTTQASIVKPIELPEDTAAAFKYVKEAVQAYPELYFSHFVILCEGDSEELILPRIAAALGVAVDEGFISIVPLAGRHVNHFWRLLKNLDIPFLTLLDFDRERFGGDWGRIKYALKQLIELGANRDELLKCKLTSGKEGTLAPGELAKMNERPPNHARIPFWLERLEEYGVFFSTPLDVDFLMLQTFPDAYKALDEGEKGPSIPDSAKNADAYAKRLEEARVATLGDHGGKGLTYSQGDRDLFPWYTYRFLGQGKPSTHILALGRLSNKQLKSSMPWVFGRLFKRVDAELHPQKAEKK